MLLVFLDDEEVDDGFVILFTYRGGEGFYLYILIKKKSKERETDK